MKLKSFLVTYLNKLNLYFRVIMRVLFDLREMEQQWQPPFKKHFEAKEVLAKEGQAFGDMNGRKVFRLIRVVGRLALVEFNEFFTLKGHLHPENRQVWVSDSDYACFSALWSNKGVTKKLRVKEVFLE